MGSFHILFHSYVELSEAIHIFHSGHANMLPHHLAARERPPREGWHRWWAPPNGAEPGAHWGGPMADLGGLAARISAISYYDECSWHKLYTNPSIPKTLNESWCWSCVTQSPQSFKVLRGSRRKPKVFQIVRHLSLQPYSQTAENAWSASFSDLHHCQPVALHLFPLRGSSQRPASFETVPGTSLGSW